MKTGFLPFTLTMIYILMGFGVLRGQTPYVKQIVTANSGTFEFAPPFNDYVTVQSYNPANASVQEFGSIYTQSAQEVVIAGGVAYVAAQDSIIKYALNTWERTGAIADSGISRMALYKGFLVVSKQYPLASNFVDILDSASLSLVGRIAGISGDCAGIACTEDTVFVAVNGGWMGTTGKIAVIDPSGWTLVREIDLGPDAIGINNLYAYQGRIYSVNKTPYGMPPVGSISMYNPADGSSHTEVLSVKIGNDASNRDAAPGVRDSVLYAIFNEGIGSFNLNTMQIIDTMVVPDPGSAIFTYIVSSCIDTINNQLHINIGNYVTPGYCLVTTLNGDSVTSYATGISSDALAADYRVSPAGSGKGLTRNNRLHLYPNPADREVVISSLSGTTFSDLYLLDLTGRTVSSIPVGPGATMVKVNLEHLPAGIYFVKVVDNNGMDVLQLIKR